MNTQELVGKVLKFVYASETYRIEITDEQQLRWTQEVGDKVGSGDTEAYVASQLDAETVMVSWVEADGLGLSNVLNFSKRTLTTHASVGRDVFENPGTLVVED